MTDTNNASQPVTDEQTAAEPISITAEGEFGSITWTPDEHAQEHLQRLTDENRQGFLAEIEAELANTARDLSTAFCVAEKLRLLMSELQSGAPFNLGIFGVDFADLVKKS